MSECNAKPLNEKEENKKDILSKNSCGEGNIYPSYVCFKPMYMNKNN